MTAVMKPTVVLQSALGKFGFGVAASQRLALCATLWRTLQHLSVQNEHIIVVSTLFVCAVWMFIVLRACHPVPGLRTGSPGSWHSASRPPSCGFKGRTVWRMAGRLHGSRRAPGAILTGQPLPGTGVTQVRLVAADAGQGHQGGLPAARGGGAAAAGRALQ